MRTRKPLFHLWGALDRGRFIAGALFALGALLALALITLDGQTGGRMSGRSFGGHLSLMLALMVSLVPLTLRRAFDLGWSVPKACLAVIGSVVLCPFSTLVFMVIPGRPRPAGGEALPPLPKLAVAAAPIVGVVIGMLVSVVFSRLE